MTDEKTLIGKEFTVVSAMEDYTVLEELDGGYLRVQLSSCRRAKMTAGIEVVHVSEIDGVHNKWHGEPYGLGGAYAHAGNFNE